MATEDDIERRELEQRVLFSLLTLIVKMAARQGLGLKDLTDWVRVAYFKELRERDLSIGEVANRLDVSERTAKNLSRQLRESFFLPERAHNLPTMIEFMLWRTPMSAQRLRQVIKGADDEAIDEALERLVDEDRVHLDTSGRTPVYVPTRSVNALLGPDWVGRIGSLNSLMSNLFDTVVGRFFTEDPRSFARTLSFYIDPKDYGRLTDFFVRQLVPFLTELDQSSNDQADTEPIRMTLFWAPTELDDDKETDS